MDGFALPAWPWLLLLFLVPAGWWLAARLRCRLTYPGLDDGVPCLLYTSDAADE